MNPRHRVVVTGMGVVSPVGSSCDAFWQALAAGRSGAGPLRAFDASALPTRIAAEVRDVEAPRSLPDRKVAFALEAARQAMAQAAACGTAPGGSDGGRDAGLSLGVGLELFSMEHLARWHRGARELPTTLPDRLTYLQTPADLALPLLAIRHGLGRPPLMHVSACAAGSDALGAAMHMVRSGRRRWMLAGGSDSMVNPLGLAGFCRLQALSTRNDAPEAASRPFDEGRDGFVLGEGAGILVLEREEDARARGAVPLAEIAGYGASFDAHGISEPHPEGRGAWQAMSRALADACIAPADVDAVNAHGTSTPKNDPVETLALKRLLGDRAREVPVVATKSMIGHLIAAAGAVETIAAILGMRAGMLHPTINQQRPDPRCDLDHVPNVARPHAQRHVLKSSFAFGGQNASLVLRRTE